MGDMKIGKESSAFGCPVCGTDITFVFHLHTEITEVFEPLFKTYLNT